MMDDLPHIVLLGLRQSGKTSIQQVVLQGVDPHTTTFLEATPAIQHRRARTHFLEFNVVDVPGQEQFLGKGRREEALPLLSRCGSIVFVLDCRQSLNQNPMDFKNGVQRLVDTVVEMNSIDPDLNIEVFLHKIDALYEAQQNDLLRRVKKQVQDGVNARITGPRKETGLPLSYHLTSIFDSSVFEAFSDVVQQLIRPRRYIASMLEQLNTLSGLRRSFLFDIQTRLCLASTRFTAARAESQIYELCSDFVEMVKSLEALYEDGDAPCACPPQPFYDDRLSSTVRLDGAELVMRRLTRTLVFVGLTEEVPDPGLMPLVDFNIGVLRDAVGKMFGLEADSSLSLPHHSHTLVDTSASSSTIAMGTTNPS